MAKQASSTQLGLQQISIYPYQPLSSYYGNEILYGVLTPGIYSATATAVIDGSNIKFTVKAGTTLVFKRSYPVPGGEIQSILGKISFTEDAAVVETIANIKGASFQNSQAIYLVANWDYDIATPDERYIYFSLEDDDAVAVTRAGNISLPEEHKIIVATFLNHQGFRVITPANATLYKVSYDYEPQRDVFDRYFNVNSQFVTDFDSNGRGVYVESGNFLSGDMLIDHQPFFNESVDYMVDTASACATGQTIYINGVSKALTFSSSPTSDTSVVAAGIRALVITNYTFTGLTNHFILTPSTTAYAPPTVALGTLTATISLSNPLPYPPRTRGASNPAGRNMIRPAVGLVDYIANYTTGVSTNITGNEANYYQIDFLRLKKDENTNLQTLGWESFLKPIGTGLGTWIVANARAYLALHRFPLSGSGMTLMIAIRPRADIPLTDGVTNILWPLNTTGSNIGICITLKDASILTYGEEAIHSRFKVPVWDSASIIGLS